MARVWHRPAGCGTLSVEVRSSISVAWAFLVFQQEGGNEKWRETKLTPVRAGLLTVRPHHPRTEGTEPSSKYPGIAVVATSQHSLRVQRPSETLLYFTSLSLGFV